MLFCSLLVVHFHLTAAARLLHSIPEDTYTFPKFRVSFLNSLPLINETAERWLKEGLRGGELEFLDQPWEEVHLPSQPSLKEIDGGQTRWDDISTPDVYPIFHIVLEYHLMFFTMYLATLHSSSQLHLGTHENESN